MRTREDCLALDAGDEPAPLRDEFALPEGVIYLDGNSLGALPKATAARVQQAVTEEWGAGLIRSWNTAGWIDLAQRIGDKIATPGRRRRGRADRRRLDLGQPVQGAEHRHRAAKADAPARRVIVSERGNFPTDLYIAETLAREHGLTLKLDRRRRSAAHLDERLAVLMLTHVELPHRPHARHGRGHARRARRRRADGLGPGAFGRRGAGQPEGQARPKSRRLRGRLRLQVPERRPRRAGLRLGASAPHRAHGPRAAAPAAVGLARPRGAVRVHADYRPALGIQRFVCGTPPLLSMAALDCGVEVFLHAEAHGGLPALRRKSLALTELFIELVEARCAGHGLELVTPRAPPRAAARRASRTRPAAIRSCRR